MPSPVPFRGMPAAQHQPRFHALDDEKRPTLSCPAAPATFDHMTVAARFSLHSRSSGQDIHRIKEAMETCARSHCLDDLPCHRGGIVEQTTQSPERPRASEGRKVTGKGTQWKYFAAKQGSGIKSTSTFQVVDTKPNQNPFSDLVAFVRSCIAPEGYPESVSSSYTPYMHWRALKYFFGGAMSVFITRSLLHAVGVSQGAASTAVAANWVIKDGAGRIGKMLFARHGKKFDCDMKQLRFMGDLLLEFGAAIELSTAAAPSLFLPLACAANVAKNVAAVTSTSTRAPIYKAFACGENIGDVTAKGECISNIADLVIVWTSRSSLVGSIIKFRV
ncbi:hypothetical protein GOP47_0029156 [Adiantum capillus-veneris]|nr:hypothetical protein GOP47_0029156 [Adiantum capillus-veneris]